MNNNERNIYIGLFWFVAAAALALALAVVAAAALALALAVMAALTALALAVVATAGDEYEGYVFSGAIVGLISGFIIAIIFIHPPIQLGSGITLTVPQGWNGGQYISQCSASTQTVSYPNGATSQVSGPISCTIEVSNQTQATKTFQIANVPANSTIEIHSFTNYTIG